MISINSGVQSIATEALPQLAIGALLQFDHAFADQGDTQRRGGRRNENHDVKSSDAGHKKPFIKRRGSGSIRPLFNKRTEVVNSSIKRNEPTNLIYLTSNRPNGISTVLWPMPNCTTVPFGRVDYAVEAIAAGEPDASKQTSK